MSPFGAMDEDLPEVVGLWIRFLLSEISGSYNPLVWFSQDLLGSSASYSSPSFQMTEDGIFLGLNFIFFLQCMKCKY